jgi:two-component system OmpR family response regulator
VSDPNSSKGEFRVLVVDDNSVVRLLVVRVLGAENIVAFVDEAAYGPTAIEKLGQAHFDLMIIDQNLPEMRGTEVIRAVRKAGYELPIILATVYSARLERSCFDSLDPQMIKVPDDEGIRMSEFSGYIQKPFDVDRLPLVVRGILTRQPGPKPIATEDGYLLSNVWW